MSFRGLRAEAAAGPDKEEDEKEKRRAPFSFRGLATSAGTPGAAREHREFRSDIRAALARRAGLASLPTFEDAPPVPRPAEPLDVDTGEAAFQGWYANVADRLGLDPDPDNPLHFYDYRSFFRSREGVPMDADEDWHFPSEFKRPGHPNQIVEGVDTRTGIPLAQASRRDATLLPPRQRGTVEDLVVEIDSPAVSRSPLRAVREVLESPLRQTVNVGATLVEGLGGLAALPALNKPLGAELVEMAGEKAGEFRRDFLERSRPQTSAGEVAQIPARIAAEIGAFFAGGAAIRGAAGIGEAATIGGRVAQGVAAMGPLDAAIAAAGPEESGAQFVADALFGEESDPATTLRENPALRAAAEVVLGATGDVLIETVRGVRAAGGVRAAARVEREGLRQSGQRIVEFVRPAGETEAAVGEAAKRAAQASESAGDAVPTGKPVTAERPAGVETVVKNSDGTELATRYRVVEADELVTSHNPETFAVNRRFPEGVQDRRYHDDPSAQAAVVKTAQELDPALVLDGTISPVNGPPIVRSDGLVISGNQRTMGITRAYTGVPGRAEAYREALAAAAPRFGLDPDEVRGLKRPVLVRELSDDVSDRGRLAELSAVMNDTPSKARDPIADAAVRARRLRETPQAIEHFAATFDPESTLRAYLETADGRDFVQTMIDTGVIPRQEAARVLRAGKDGIARLNDEEKLVVERMMELAAVGDPEVVARAPSGALRKIAQALPAIVRASSVEGFDLGPTLRGALDLLAAVAASKSASTVDELVANIDAFGREFAPDAVELARVLESEGPRAVTERFRSFAADAESFRRMSQSEDLFGEAPRGPREAFTTRFREAAFAPRRARGERALSVGQDDLFGGTAPAGGGEQFRLFEESAGAPQTLQSAEREATRTVERLSSKPDLTPEERESLREALGLLRRGESYSADELRLRAEGQRLRGEEPEDLFGGGERAMAVHARPMSATEPGYISELLPPHQPFGAGPVVPAELPQVLSRQEIIRQLDETLDAVTRVGKRRFGRALGLYSPKTEVTRLAKSGDVVTRFHEAGHHLHKLMFGRAGLTKSGDLSNKVLQPWDAELVPLAKGISDESLAEGEAEFFRLFLQEPAEAVRRAPRFHAFVESYLERNPEIAEGLADVRDQWALYVQGGAEARIEAQIARSAKRHRSLRDRWDRFRTGVIDDLDPLERFTRGIEEQTAKIAKRGAPGAAEAENALVRFSEDAAGLARLARGSVGAALEFIENGAIDWNFNRVGKGLREILQPVKDDLDAFSRYATSRRAIELHGREIDSGVRLEDAQFVVGRYDRARPEFRAAFGELQDYNGHLLEYLRDAGVLTPEAFDAIRAANTDYVPFYRVKEGAKGPGLGGERLGHVFSPVKRIRGSDREIIDPISSIVRNTVMYVQTAHRQEVSRALWELSKREGVGKFIEEIPGPVRSTEFRFEEIRRRLGEIIGTGELDEMIERLPGEARDRLASELLAVWRPGDWVGKPNVISVVDGGKRRWFEIQDPELYKSLEGLERKQIGLITRMLAVPARTLRAGATLAPEFLARNPIRDNLMAFVQSEYGFKPGIDFARGIFHALRRDDLYSKWRAAGGEFATVVDLDRAAYRGKLKQLIERGGVSGVAKHPWEALRALSALMENGTRLGEFSKAVRQLEKEGHSGRELWQRAALASREVTVDFARHGAKTEGVRLTAAFWNARLQGYDRLARAFRKNPVRTSVRALTGITLPTLLYYAVNREDPEYWEQPQWMRDLFWMVKVDGTWIRIPKPFELGTVFGTIPERLLEWWDSEDPEGLTEALSNTFQRELTSTVLPIPTALAVPLENFFNYSMFLERPIVSRALENVEPEFQENAGTSDVARGLSRMLAPVVREGLVGSKARSAIVAPAKIDNALNSWFGGLGRTVTGAVDVGARATGLSGRPRQADRLGPNLPIPGTGEAIEFPGVRGFLADEPGSSSESVERFYREWAAVSGIKSTADLLRREGRVEDLSEYLERHGEDLLRWRELNSVRARLSGLMAERTRVIRDRELTPAEKREQLETIGTRILETAREVLRSRRSPSR